MNRDPRAGTIVLSEVERRAEALRLHRESERRDRAARIARGEELPDETEGKPAPRRRNLSGEGNWTA